MNYCSKCGTALADGAKFCHECGFKQKGLISKIKKRISREDNHENVQATGNRAKKYSRSEKTYSPIKVGVLAVLAILLVGFGSYYICSLTLSTSDIKESDIYSKLTPKSNDDSKSDATNKSADKNQSKDSKIDESTNHGTDKISSKDDYMFSNSGSKKLLDSDLSSLSKEKLALARNEIFARHGYVFETEPYKSYFKNKSWYKPNSNFKGNNEELSKIERYNIDLILKYEKR
ncbi:YARHG domain-containing protein [Clostridium magnum]|uniref:YARHG domain-containing protein n=1 Tax=Clostridium magnum DSM 2767 TaxID=1121326 RepID=A0A161WQQ3_9CLOT|nr:YARHG domain-containing protein [Clostridium magnum]KZL89008.1 hypothetical protein CLMAG_57060 [Clostridium magnum DSM 2767]SHI23332.1 zinc-ribbon domain-containing protein [Clostridium magnum DSM 2767]